MRTEGVHFLRKRCSRNAFQRNNIDLLLFKRFQRFWITKRVKKTDVPRVWLQMSNIGSVERQNIQNNIRILKFRRTLFVQNYPRTRLFIGFVRNEAFFSRTLFNGNGNSELNKLLNRFGRYGNARFVRYFPRDKDLHAFMEQRKNVYFNFFCYVPTLFRQFRHSYSSPTGAQKVKFQKRF